ncbi:MAG: DUF2062 domain-containing protein [Thiobacillaceae bacterium]|nr:DUF2062 domain-containing protein [Thiobacillaceae bacterium]
MPRKHFRKYLPDHETVRNHRHLRHFRPLLRHPNLWHLNRHSVAGGVAAGLFGGMIPAPIQILTAALLAIVFRVNLPVAVATTLLTNPLTWPFIIVGAMWIGTLVTGEQATALQPFQFDWFTGDFGRLLPELWGWLMGMGKPFALGLLILAALAAAAGYLLVQFAWRLYIFAYLRRRRARRPTP